MKKNKCYAGYQAKKISVVLLAGLFVIVQVSSVFSAPPPPRGGGGPGPGGRPGPVHHGGGHGHSGPSPGAVIGTAIGAIAVGAAVGAAMNAAAPKPAPAAPAPAPATVITTQPHVISATTASPIAYGSMFSVLPAGYTAVMASGQLYYYYAGTYYMLTSSGYKVVPPPAGAVIATLPSNCATVQVNGVLYYSYAGAYYQRVDNGFQVIAELPAITQKVADSGKVMVTSASLNVRSGPGKNKSVITTVFSGDLLEIIGHAPDWYYVRLPDGTAGWVMAQFTTVLAQSADG